MASKIGHIGLVSLTNGREEERAVSQLNHYCKVVRQVHILRSTTLQLRDLLLAQLGGKPYVVQAATSAQMMQAVSETIEHWQPDIVQAEWIGAVPYLEEARRRGVPTIYAAHNVEHQVTGYRLRAWQRQFSSFSPSTLQAFETDCASKVDLVVTVSEQDKKWFQPFCKQVICIPNAIHPDEYTFLPPAEREKGSVVFVGHLRYPPNLEAARELITGILPRIQQQLPRVSCVIAGRQPPSSLRRLAARNPAVHIQGDVKDIRTVWAKASTLICPLVSGGGSRIKLLEAAACGVPIIATPFSAMGLALTQGKDFIAAADSIGLADASVAVLQKPGHWDTLARHARNTVILHHNWDTLAENIQRLYEDIAYNHR